MVKQTRKRRKKITPGKGTPGRQIKRRWLETNTRASLKAWARAQVEHGTEHAGIARAWLDSKRAQR